ncbi:MAG: oligosaccharyl transferase, archaeosortase A system-associated, partial [Methanofollis liminatans]|nr:oligosaccharyl transferase, archaeosortase A system-associated [Methanofollis liminatans]
ESGSYNRVQLNTPAYYRTMVSRLHNFDGSMAEPSQVVYVEYTEAGVSGFSAPVITNAMMLNGSEAQAKADAYNANAPAGKGAGLFGTDNNLTLPPEEVSALQHFRLVFESSQNVYNAVTPNIKYVKVFEYVQGARIAGEGTIEVDLKANTGRTFTYRQESVNGVFVVPYSTSGNPYGVTALGPYRIVGTGQTIEVSEDAVMQGLTVG